MALVDFSEYPTLLDERFREVEEQFYAIANSQDIIPRLYDVRNSDRRQERHSAVGEMPDWVEFDGQLQYRRRHEQYQVVSTHKEFALGMRVTLRMLEDELERIFEGEDFEALLRAGHHTRQRHATRLFNLATINDQVFYQRSEGLPLASANHTTRTPGISTAVGFDNLILGPLTPLTYRAARIQMRSFVNDVGQEADIIGDELWVPIDGEPRALEIIGTDRYPDSAENRPYPERNTAAVQVARLWNRPDDWALMNMQLRRRNCRWWERVAMTFRTFGEFDTFQVKSSGRGRWSPMVRDWRFMVYGSV